MVPEAGLEPARLAPHAPQTCVAATSTTPAGLTPLRREIQRFHGTGTVRCSCQGTRRILQAPTARPPLERPIASTPPERHADGLRIRDRRVLASPRRPRRARLPVR